MDPSMQADTAVKVDAEIAKLIAETMLINSQAKWYPFVVVAGVFAAAVALVKFVV